MNEYFCFSDLRYYIKPFSECVGLKENTGEDTDEKWYCTQCSEDIAKENEPKPDKITYLDESGLHTWTLWL